MACSGDPAPLPVEGRFALLLTHDVDRPYKSLQAPYYALRDRDPGHLRALRPSVNPWWQFESVMNLEADLGVRSAFYFLNEPHLLRKGLRALASPRAWVEQLGRYDVWHPRVADVVRTLDDGGWEVGVHGSLASARDGQRLHREKQTLEAVLGDVVRGGRQHRLRLDRPETWRRQRRAGLQYDATLGVADDWGFAHGHDPLAPFDDEFLVFPLTLMEQALPDPGERFEAAWDVCVDLLDEAAEEGAVMTVLWHPRYFNRREFPGYRRLYDRLLERALAMDAWVGPPGDLHAELVGDG